MIDSALREPQEVLGYTGAAVVVCFSDDIPLRNQAVAEKERGRGV